MSDIMCACGRACVCICVCVYVPLGDNIKGGLTQEDTRTQHQHQRTKTKTDERRMCPTWLLATVVLVGVARGAASQCWEHASCQELDSKSLMDCLQLCHADLSDLNANPGPVQPPPIPESDPSPPAKRSYAMEHFRWGKPVGRKRRPIKVYTPNGVEEESSEVFPGEMRRELKNEPPVVSEEEGVMEEDGVQKKDDTYKMKHFRWSSPPPIKRYGGFMKGWVQAEQRPLVTLLKNVINKDGQTQK
ncbi:pro-opiomelanocortin-like [Syngnathus acus]|uniref:pro-opiomelanocortin-like n=1 Tax=Syngnathus acus TaxID=161584 RepID=UPI001885D8E4|nr:pro-opiomelanocortin-like [Syngnathus acus]